MNKTVKDLLLQLANEMEKEDQPSKAPAKRRGVPATRETITKVLDYVKGHGGATAKDVLEGTGLKAATVYNYLTQLVKEGQIVINKPNGIGARQYSFKGTVSKEDESDKDTANDKILQFVSDNHGKRYSIRQMAESIGVSTRDIYYMVNKLQKRKLLEKDFNLGSEPLEGEKLSSKVDKTSLPPVEEKKDTLSDQIEFLAWTYIKETKDASLLSFLGWLEAKSK